MHIYKYLIYRICLLCSIDEVSDCPYLSKSQYKLRISVPKKISWNKV